MVKIFSSFFSSKSNKADAKINAPTQDKIPLADSIKAQLVQYANAQTAQKSAAFHKSTINDAENRNTDIFLGVPKPTCKQIAQQYAQSATWSDISQLLSTPNSEHEVKLVACLILIAKAKDTTNQNSAKAAYDFYFKHLAAFTSWDLIDETAPTIIGDYLQAHPSYPRDDIYRLIKSRSDWDKRIALVATQAFIENNNFDDALKLCKLCFNELSPMIQKTAGKLLKEVGKKNKQILFEFIANNQTKMPKDMLNAAMGNLSTTLKKTIRSETRILAKK